MNINTLEERLVFAASKLDLKKEVREGVVGHCQREGLDTLAGISTAQLESYAKKVVVAAYLDIKCDVDGDELNWFEQYSELADRAMADITKLLRLKALNKLK